MDNTDQEARNAHYRTCLRNYAGWVTRGDVDAVCTLFAEDAVIDDPAGTPPKVGAAAVREFYEWVAEQKVELEIIGPVTGSHTNSAAMQMNVTLQGITLQCTSVAEFNAAGKIVHYVAHWGPGDFVVGNTVTTHE